VREICRETAPKLAPAEEGRRVACHFWADIGGAGGMVAMPQSERLRLRLRLLEDTQKGFETADERR
jgi:hypothetical protein